MVTACSKVHPKAAVQPSPKSNQPTPKIAALIAQLDSPKESIRANAVEELNLGHLSARDLPQEDIPPLISRLIPLLHDPEFHVRDHAVSVLGRMGKDAKVAVPAIIPLLKQEVPLARRSAVRTMGEIGEPAKAAIPDIIPLLKHKDVGMRAEAVEALGKLGKSTPEAVLPEMTRLLNDREPYVRDGAIGALGEIGKSSPDLVMPHLLKLLKSHDSRIRGRTMMALANMRSAAKAAVPELLKMRSNDDVDSKDAVDWTLERIGREPLPE
jgi:HEAT repeat protein